MTELLKGALFALACVIASCLVSTMALFMGGGQDGADLQVLMHLQMVSVPLGLTATVHLLIPRRGEPVSRRLRSLYAAIPHWLVFSAILLNLLVLSGELALVTVALATDKEVPWSSHIPLASMMTSSLAFCLLFGKALLDSGQTKALSGRWAP